MLFLDRPKSDDLLVQTLIIFQNFSSQNATAHSKIKFWGWSLIVKGTKTRNTYFSIGKVRDVASKLWIILNRCLVFIAYSMGVKKKLLNRRHSDLSDLLVSVTCPWYSWTIEYENKNISAIRTIRKLPETIYK